MCAHNLVLIRDVASYRYTSLGSTYNTFPNPLLRATDDASVLGGWRPAWELKDPLQERAGRYVILNMCTIRAALIFLRPAAAPNRPTS